MRPRALLLLCLLATPVLAVDPALRKKVKSSDSFERSGAAEALGKEGSADAARLLATLLTDKDPYVRDAAVKACRGVTNADAVELLARATALKTDLDRLNLAEALGRSKSAAALPRLSTVVAGKGSPGVRAHALDWMWGFRGNDDAGAVALGACADASPVVRASAIEAAGRLRVDGALAATKAALADKDVGVRCVALMELRYLARDEALTALAAAAKDPEWRIRAQVVENALYSKEREAVDALVWLVADTTLRVAAAAHRALIALTGKVIARDPELWRAWWKENRESWRAPKGRVDASSPPKGEGYDARGAARFYGVEVDSGHVAFVLDASGSMREKQSDGRTRWQAVVAEFKSALDAMPDTAEVDVIIFQEKISACFGKPTKLTKTTRKKAASFVTRVGPGHRGDLLGGMRMAFETAGADTIILLSDGAPSAGDVVDRGRVKSILRSINRMEKRAIHTIAFGTKRRPDLDFMANLARDGGGVAATE